MLTVGGTSDFLAGDGAIDFLIAEDKLQFEVNIMAASDAHRRISSNTSGAGTARHHQDGGGEKLTDASSNNPLATE